MAEEYIKREAAKRLFANSHDYGLARKLDEIPAADVVEVRHGRWVPIKRRNIWGDKADVLKCSVCKKSDVDGTGITKRLNYCPNCGARMDGGDDAY